MPRVINNIVVCVKQVPATTEVRMDPVTNTIIREGIESVINPFDTYAIEEAIRLKEKFAKEQQPCHIAAISMGIPSVEDLLKEAMALGVDEGILLSDKEFAGADTLATAYALSCGINAGQGYDLIICGKQATDGDTAQVGPSLAERLGIPHLTDVSCIERVTNHSLICRRLVDDGYERAEIMLPCVITVVKEINTPRLPSIRGLKRARSARVAMWKAADVAADTTRTGLAGSPTKVVQTFVPQKDSQCEMIEGSVPQVSGKLLEKLQQRGLL